MTNTEILNAPERLLTGINQQRRFLLQMAKRPRPCPACQQSCDQIRAYQPPADSILKSEPGDLDAYPVGTVKDDAFACPSCSVRLRIIIPLFGPEGWLWAINEPVMTVREATMRFDVNGYGFAIPLTNAIWTSCADLGKVKALSIGETSYRVPFQTGAGKSEHDITRVA